MMQLFKDLPRSLKFWSILLGSINLISFVLTMIYGCQYDSLEGFFMCFIFGLLFYSIPSLIIYAIINVSYNLRGSRNKESVYKEFIVLCITVPTMIPFWVIILLLFWGFVSLVEQIKWITNYLDRDGTN